MRRCTVRSFAKLNLDLRVYHRRPDGFHELRTVFQTISLSDRLEIEFEPGRRTRISLDGNVEIPENLVVRAAEAVCAAGGRKGEIRFRLKKSIPMGGGLGGGSSNAAAVLLALPALTGFKTDAEQLRQMGEKLGSDVPFFLYGGTALGLGRGTELYPLPDLPARQGLLVAPAVHSSTAEAYRALGRGLTTPGYEPDTNKFQSVVWGFGSPSSGCWPSGTANDFEGAVFGQFPRLESIRDKLRQAGADPAMMTGSGSSIFGLFDSRISVQRASARMERGAEENDRRFVFSLVSRKRYMRLWRGWLGEHITGNSWPPRSRY